MNQADSPSVLVLEKTFPCTAEKVWKFWTVPDLMRLWFGSDPNGSVLTASSNVEIGGNFSVTFEDSDETEHTCTGSYLVVEPFSALTFTWYWKGRERNTEVVSVGFSEVEQGVRMKLTHKDIDPATSHDYRAGWTLTFEKLARATLKSL